MRRAGCESTGVYRRLGSVVVEHGLTQHPARRRAAIAGHDQARMPLLCASVILTGIVAALTSRSSALGRRLFKARLALRSYPAGRDVSRDCPVSQDSRASCKSLHNVETGSRQRGGICADGPEPELLTAMPEITAQFLNSFTRADKPHLDRMCRCLELTEEGKKRKAATAFYKVRTTKTILVRRTVARACTIVVHR